MYVCTGLPTLCDPALGDCDLSGAGSSSQLRGLPLDGVSAWGAISRGEAGRRREIMHDLWFQVSEPFHFFVRPILTDSYLCHACSCQESEDGNAPGQGNPDPQKRPTLKPHWAALHLDGMKLLIGSGATDWQLYNISVDVSEKHNLMGEPSVASAQARIVARMAYWTQESAHVFDQNSLGFDPRSNPTLNADKAWLPWCPDSGCTPAPPPAPKPPIPPPPPTTACRFTPDMDYYPAHTQAIHATDPSDCCQKCKQDAQCFVAVFNNKQGGCYFKPSNATRRPRAGSLSCAPRP
jgi:hypothetical protein|eukprot:COSAG01_NODE_1301_length_10829_cov_20.185182_8_plen_293_part_00